MNVLTRNFSSNTGMILKSGYNDDDVIFLFVCVCVAAAFVARIV